MRCSWFKDHARQVHMDFHMAEFPREAITRFDATAFVDHLERGKVNLVALFAKDHFGNCFYNTRVGHKHSGLKEDFLLETSEECRKRGIRTLAYYSVCWDRLAWEQNPLSRYVDRDGRESGAEDPITSRVCMNTPYKDELYMPQIEEIAQYPVDGFFLDIPMPYSLENTCFCETCKRRYAMEFGKPLTFDQPYSEHEIFNMRTAATYLREMRAILNAQNPELVICANGFGYPKMSKELKELIEIGCWESQPHPGDYLGHSFSCRTGRNDILDVQVMTVRFYEGWGDLTLKPAPQLTTECAVMLGNGMVPCVGDQVNIDGTLQPAVYDTFAESFGFVEAHETILRGAESVRHALMLWPVPSPELPMQTVLGPTYGDALDSWRGLHKMLVESHIQLDIMYSVLVEDLSRYPMIILPEPWAYEPDMEARLRSYVEQGGILVAIGNSLLDHGTVRMQDVFGIEWLEPLSFSLCHFTVADALKGSVKDIPLQLRGQAYKVRATSATELAALWYPESEHQPPVRAFRSPYPPAADARSPFSFATVNEFGKGRAAYIAASISDVYWKTNHHWLREFTEALLRHVDPSMPYTVDAAGTIEANLMEKDGDLLLNLMQYHLGHQGGQNAIAGIERVHAVREIACTVRAQSVSEVVWEPRGESLPFAYEDGVCSFAVPEVEYLSIIRLKA